MPQPYVALPSILTVTEGQSITTSLSFLYMQNNRVTYEYFVATGTADGGDIFGSTGGGSMSVVAFPYTSEHIPIQITARADDVQEETETARLVVNLAGDMYFSDGTQQQIVTIQILDDNRTEGGAGNDILRGTSAAERLAGGAGHDRYFVNAGDIVSEAAGEGVDTVLSYGTWALHANVENLELLGQAAANAYGNALNNRISGNAGANLIDGLGGEDTMTGGGGNDVYVVDSASDLVIEQYEGGTDVVRAAISHTLGANVETLVLVGTEALNGIGNALANTIYGNASANFIDGALGDDIMVGGAGNDVYLADSARDLIFEGAGGGTDVVRATASHVMGTNVETLVLLGTGAINGTGSAQANTIYGNAAENVIDGGAGADIMNGGAGNDSYVVDDARDIVFELANGGVDSVRSSVSLALSANVEHVALLGDAALWAVGNELGNGLTGNAGANILNGLAGNDVLIGGLGADRLLGSAGADQFVFRSAAESRTAAARDVILDFRGAEGDRIDLRGIDSHLGRGGDQAFQMIGARAFSGAAGELRYQQVNNSTILTGDTNGDRVADFSIELAGRMTLTTSDFLL